MLQFFGRGSAFADQHNAAFFREQGDLILLDCPGTAFQKVKRFDWSNVFNVYVLVTHTHGDHIGGLGTLLQYLFFTQHKRLTVVAPSELVREDLQLQLIRIEGCQPEWFSLLTVQQLQKPWLQRAVLTEHTDTLRLKCYGYVLTVAGKTVVYTGDTRTLEPFLPYLHPGSFLYTELAAIQSGVHLYVQDVLPRLKALSEQGVFVFLMHLDCEEEISRQIQGTAIQLAPLYSSSIHTLACGKGE